jgi:hypothetical protein
MIQAAGMVAVAMRHDGKVERGEIDALGLHVVRKDLGVFARVEQDAFAYSMNAANPQSLRIVEDLPKASYRTVISALSAAASAAGAPTAVHPPSSASAAAARALEAYVTMSPSDVLHSWFGRQAQCCQCRALAVA